MTAIHADPDAALLLKGVIADPDADGPRLMLADCLEGLGESDRAEFIRVQCEIVVLEKALNDCWCDDGRGDPECEKCVANRAKWDALRRRERELLFSHGYSWLPDIPEVNGVSGWVLGAHGDGRKFQSNWQGFVFAVFRRGFAESVTLDWPAWAAHHAALTASTPIRAVRLTTRPVFEGLVYDKYGWACVRVAGELVRVDGGDDADHLSKRWPGVAFELPPPEAPRQAALTADDFRQVGESMRRIGRDEIRRMTAGLDGIARQLAEVMAPVVGAAAFATGNLADAFAAIREAADNGNAAAAQFLRDAEQAGRELRT